MMTDKCNTAPKFAARPPNPKNKISSQIQKLENEHEENQNKIQESRAIQNQIVKGLLDENDIFKQTQINKMRDTLEFLFAKSRDNKSQRPYFNDGDPRMYSTAALEKRKQLKNDQSIIEALQNFIKLYKFDVNECIDKEEYLRLQIPIAKVLRPDLFSQDKKEDLINLIEEDWNHDRKGKSRISREELFDILFEMVDIWTPNADPEQYREFFYMLKEKIRVLPNPYYKGAYNQLDSLFD